jgi:hypothetical protein
VERARIVRNLTEAGLARAIQGLLDPAGGRRGALVWRSASQAGSLAGRSPRIRELGRFVRRPTEGRGSPPAGTPAGAGGGAPTSASAPLPASTPGAPDPTATPASSAAAPSTTTSTSTVPARSPRVPEPAASRSDGEPPRPDDVDDGEPVGSVASGAARAPR